LWTENNTNPNLISNYYKQIKTYISQSGKKVTHTSTAERYYNVQDINKKAAKNMKLYIITSTKNVACKPAP